MNPLNWIAKARAARHRRRLLVLELQLPLGPRHGRHVARACLIASLLPGYPDHESMLRACRTMAQAGWL